MDKANKPGLKSIKCTQCGGSIEIRGGHNVRSIVCQYCGSCLDTKDEFKVLHQFLNKKRPFMPMKIGLKGKLKGINFTVIGVLQMEQREFGEIYRWLEYLLFSPTHGYVWLIFEDGHWVMLHEVKDMPEEHVDLTMPRKSTFKVRDKTFKVFECSSAQISYVEGELTWQAKAKEKVRYLDAVCPPYMYCLERRGTEVEYFWGEYVPYEEINEAFKINSFEPTGVFSCQPFKISPIFEGLSKGAAVAAGLALLFYFIVSSNGSVIFSEKLGAEVFKDGKVSKVFKADDPDALYGIRLHTPTLKNRWSYYDINVIDEHEKNSYFQMPAYVEYYSGYSGGEHWSEGSTEITSYFQVPDKGGFKLAITGEGGKYNKPRKNFALSRTLVEIRKGVVQGHYTLIWFFISLLLAAPYFLLRWSFEGRRWADDDDEDD